MAGLTEAQLVEATLAGELKTCRAGHGHYMPWPWPEGPHIAIRTRVECPKCIVERQEREKLEAEEGRYVQSFYESALLAAKDQGL